MRVETALISAIFAVFGLPAIAGTIGIPMPGAGVFGPAVLVATIGAVVGIKYLRNRRPK